MVGADSPCRAESFSYFSRYIRMVAPAEPVPLSRKTTRAGSPLLVSNPRINPCLLVVEPSTGSVYLLREDSKKIQPRFTDGVELGAPLTQILRPLPS